MTYEEIVNKFRLGAECHNPVLSFASGPLHYLDSSDQNRIFPYIYLRPLTSPGLQLNQNTRTFELYSLDIPSISDDSPVVKMSETEQYIYDIIAYFNRGLNQQDLEITLSQVSPLWESFADRAYGWLAQINVNSTQVIDYCAAYPDN